MGAAVEADGPPAGLTRAWALVTDDLESVVVVEGPMTAESIGAMVEALTVARRSSGRRIPESWHVVGLKRIVSPDALRGWMRGVLARAAGAPLGDV